MKELITMWKNTRMVVFVVLTASVYAAVLLPFKVFTIIPGFTELRPANAVPIVFSLMFGPAAAWGSAIGNLIGDAFGATFGLGSIFGFVGNFLYGYIPYKIWNALTVREPVVKPTESFLEHLPAVLLTTLIYLTVVGSCIYTLGLVSTNELLMLFALVVSILMSPLVIISLYRILEYLLVALLASLACGVFIGWGVDMLKLGPPFVALGNVIVVNNFIMAITLGPPLLNALFPRVRRWGLFYRDVMRPEDFGTMKFNKLAAALMGLGGVSGLILGNLIGFNLVTLGIYTAAGMAIALGLVPSIILIFLAIVLF